MSKQQQQQQKNSFKFELLQGNVFILPYPTISDLAYIYTDQTDDLINQVYALCTPQQQALFEDDFMLLGELTNAVLNYHYSVITAKPRMEGFFDYTLRKEEESLSSITDPEELREKRNSIENRKKAINPPPPALLKAVLKYSQTNDSTANFNSWLRVVADHLNTSMHQVQQMPYDQFIEASNSLTIQNDIRIANDIELEQQRTKQAARQK
jgi:hypothetical protein